MKELILTRIQAIKTKENNFPMSLMRWQVAYFVVDGKRVHVSEVDVDKLTDEQLLDYYEYLLRRSNIQM